MADRSNTNSKKTRYHLPHLGMRIVKTGICVFFCLLLNYLFSAQVALISSLAAIVSMQSTLENTMKTAVSRFVGTAIGGLCGMLLLPLAPQMEIEWLYIILMPLGMIATIYLCVAIKMAGAASICAFVYITVLVVPFSSGVANGTAYLQATIRILDTAVGVTIALLVNRFIAPPRPKPIHSVEIPSNVFSNIYSRVADRLTGTEELILLDTRLINPAIEKTTPDMRLGGIRPGVSSTTVSIPVPTEFKNQRYITAVYIGADYSVTPFNLRQTNEYVDLPCEAFPVTVAWHVNSPTGKETYGLLRHHAKTHPGLRLGTLITHRLHPHGSAYSRTRSILEKPAKAPAAPAARSVAAAPSPSSAPAKNLKQ